MPSLIHILSMPALQAPSTLAQLGGAFEAPVLPSVPEPGLLEQWLFESPWPLMGGLMLLAIVIAWSLRTSRRLAAGLAMLAGALLALGVFGIASNVRTDRERLFDGARALIAGVADADAGAIEPLLDERVVLRSRWFRSGRTKPQILDTVASAENGIAALSRYDIKELRGGVRPDGSGVVLVRLVVVPSATEAPVGMWWQLGSVRRPTEDGPRDNDWRVISIEPLWFAGAGDVSAR
ncbi:MAG: hypothetical protein AAGK04_02880 [Planctomycetota bacterium]